MSRHTAFKIARLHALASLRHGHPLGDRYDHPETFGFDGDGWVSPYTRGANNVDADLMLILQDWASADSLRQLTQDERNDIAEYGRNRALKTNRRLEELLERHFRKTLAQTYTTNLFPFIKRNGTISAPIPFADLRRAAEDFTIREIEIVDPKCVIVFGRAATVALRRAQEALAQQQIDKTHSVVHPAARKSVEEHNMSWQQVVRRAGIR